MNITEYGQAIATPGKYPLVNPPSTLHQALGNIRQEITIQDVNLTDGVVVLIEVRGATTPYRITIRQHQHQP